MENLQLSQTGETLWNKMDMWMNQSTYKFVKNYFEKYS